MPEDPSGSSLSLRESNANGSAKRRRIDGRNVDIIGRDHRRIHGDWSISPLAHDGEALATSKPLQVDRVESSPSANANTAMPNDMANRIQGQKRPHEGGDLSTPEPSIDKPEPVFNSATAALAENGDPTAASQGLRGELRARAASHCPPGFGLTPQQLGRMMVSEEEPLLD